MKSPENRCGGARKKRVHRESLPTRRDAMGFIRIMDLTLIPIPFDPRCVRIRRVFDASAGRDKGLSDKSFHAWIAKQVVQWSAVSRRTHSDSMELSLSRKLLFALIIRWLINLVFGIEGDKGNVLTRWGSID